MKESVHIHVDNGGYTFEVRSDYEDPACVIPKIVVTDGYYGYSVNTMEFRAEITPKNLLKIANMFLRASEALEKEMVVS